MAEEVEALSNYFAILKGKALPAFKLARKIRCEQRGSLEEMWEEHRRAAAVILEEGGAAAGRQDAPYSFLDLKLDIAQRLLESCVLCERRCRANRKEGRLGWCRVGAQSRVASCFEHWGEEACLIPSGTIFFAGCNWRCCYCQNFDISQFPQSGVAWGGKEIAGWLDRKAASGAVINANFVGGDPTPNLHTIIDAARNMKSSLPLVWNSNMYMSEESMELLDGLVDVYLADFRYGNDECAMRLSEAPNCLSTTKRNFLLASSHAELIVRVLVLPSHIDCCARNIIAWLGENLPDKAYVNLMSQYRPCYKAFGQPDIARQLKKEEFLRAAAFLQKSRIKNYEIQGLP
ncbi:MAG: 4Fe-4S cluster-binding domain-containing protein [Candidatus Micrarchaeota archaeon]|nr:4Fe-4S cluster-binding domain-containing protein [Candidatus Micrarchaeota archaeon]